MSTVTAKPRSTILQQWANTPAGGQAHQKVTDGTVDVPVTSTFCRCTTVAQAERTNEYGDVDLSAIPDGSTINEIQIRKYSRARLDDVTLDVPDEEFKLKVSGVVRETKLYGVDTGAVDMIQHASFTNPNITAAELKTANAFSFSITTKLGDGSSDPLPQG